MRAALLDETGDADRLMTADRAESKYALDPRVGAALARVIAEHLPTHRFQGAGATILPDGQEFTSTVYFDTPQRDLFREATTTASHLKLRAREYYTLHPSLTEIATDPRQLVRYSPVLWLEIKDKDASRTRKRRIALPKADVPAFFAGGMVSRAMVVLGRSAYGEDTERVLAEVAALCRRYGTPVAADCVVNYRRTAWQDDAGHLRLTLDRGVSFYAPPADLWTRDFGLVRETLGDPASRLEFSVLEVKSRGGLPEWLEAALGELPPEPARFSKFVAASQAVHG